MEKNELPENWTCSQISDISKLIRGVSYKKSDSSKVKKNNSVGILRGTNIQSKLILEELVYAPKKYVKTEQYVQKMM